MWLPDHGCTLRRCQRAARDRRCAERRFQTGCSTSASSRRTCGPGPGLAQLPSPSHQRRRGQERPACELGHVQQWRGTQSSTRAAVRKGCDRLGECSRLRLPESSSMPLGWPRRSQRTLTCHYEPRPREQAHNARADSAGAPWFWPRIGASGQSAAKAATFLPLSSLLQALRLLPPCLCCLPSMSVSAWETPAPCYKRPAPQFKSELISWHPAVAYFSWLRPLLKILSRRLGEGHPVHVLQASDVASRHSLRRRLEAWLQRCPPAPGSLLRR